ncbi:DUF2332 domain-containing protein [Phycicoccus endophyticus]|uniref:DUF2332 domain-containing protein n=1 Tax=Phycicoccus endophyticus TaxID=1690220 RepID=UPI0019BDF4B6|nr:DUF2332 domain-containing protein [Phycicoccus endophyticus]GGL31133.1 hypothetical protein GCM10012283_11820 [Phycicoccus endophyticus]
MAGAAASLPERLRAHFGHREHLYGVLLAEMAEDWERGGVTRELLAGWEGAEARQVPQLRLLAGLFRIVLRGEAPQLLPFYPVLGGRADPAGAWKVVRPVLRAHAAELRASLEHPPQTNEPGRAVALLVGLAEAVRRTGMHRVRLLEPGASGGLGLLVDHYRFEGEGWSAGPPDAGLVVTGCGAPGFSPEPFEVVSRRGCDIAPVDTSGADGATLFTSFVWPWMLERHARLEAALAEARRHPVAVDRASAAAWVRDQLARPAPAGVLTVVWHSVTRMYWPVEETLAMEAAVEEARGRMPLAHVSLEHGWPEGGVVTARDDDLVPRVELDGAVLGTAGHHGPPLTLGGS